MDKALLKKHIEKFISDTKKDEKKFAADTKERSDFIAYYQGYSMHRILAMNEDEIYEYISNLWAMLIWGNKHYVVDKIIGDNGLANFKKSLAHLIWSTENIGERWDGFRRAIKGMGPARRY